MQVEGEECLSIYQARVEDANRGGNTESPAQRHFCSRCGSALWLWGPRWPELVHPFASAIDTELPVPPQRTHMMLKYAETWIEPDIREGDEAYDVYPEESLLQWHERHSLDV